MIELKNLRPYRKDYRYQTGEVGDIIRVEVEYDKGYTLSRRGIYLRVSKVKIAFSDSGMRSESFNLSDEWMGLALKQLQRNTPSELDRIAALLDPIVPEIAEAWKTEDKAKVTDLVKAVLNASA